MMAAALRRASGVVVPQPLPWHRRLVAFLAVSLLRLCLSSWRCRWIAATDNPDERRNVIYCVWHNQLPLALAHYMRSRTRWPAAGLAAVISASRDGGLLASVVESFGIQPIRGSTSRRGPQALLEATTWVERNFSVVITPDGPRGPVYRIQDGIIQLAKLTGRPIIPLSGFTPWKIRLRSWDRFQIPLPFALCEMRYADPICVPREATDAELEQLRLKLEQSMRAITRDDRPDAANCQPFE
jgi:hypothetical protein